MYEQFLFIHSWTRWAVLLALVYFSVKSTYGWIKKSNWTAADNHFVWVFNQALGFQVLFGIALWIGMSPITKIAFNDSSQFFDNPLVFFWSIRHPLTMILSYAVFLFPYLRLKRAPSASKNKIYALTFWLILVIVATAIPWPGLSYGRNLFRWIE